MENKELKEKLRICTERMKELGEMLEEVEEQLEESQREVVRLKEENEWMHDTIWALTRKLKKMPMQKDEENEKRD